MSRLKYLQRRARRLRAAMRPVIDKAPPSRQGSGMRRLIPLLAALALAPAAPAQAVVGGQAAEAGTAAQVVMIVSDRGSFCSAAVLGPRLLLTAGHCVRPGANYRLLTYAGAQPVLGELAAITLHPQFDPAAYAKRRFVVDLALATLKAPLPGGYAPIALPSTPEAGVMGARYSFAGFGLSVRGDGKTGGTLRQATLTGVPLQSRIQLRLQDPGKREIGACQGDSGGPVFRVSDAAGAATAPVLVGVLGSALGEEGQRGCGGFTGVALIGTALPWIRQAAARLGAPLP